MKFLLTLTFLFFCHFSFCQKLNSDSLIIYSHDNYKIQYPSTWRIDTTKDSNVEFVIYSPREYVDDKFSENVNLMIQDFKGQNIDLDKYAALSEKAIKNNAVGLTGFTSKKSTQNQTEFYELEFEMTFNSLRLHTVQYYFVENEKAIAITYSSEINKPKEMTTIGHGILKSFIYSSK